MGEFFLILGLLLLTALIFVTWLIVRVTTLIFRGIFGLARRPATTERALALPPGLGWSHCRHPGCRDINPPHAQYCRRCGTAVAAGTNAPKLRYVA